MSHLPVLQAVKPLGALVMGMGFQQRVDNRRRIPERGAVLILAKHQRWEDIPLLALAAPRSLYYVAKQELFVHPLTAALISALGGIPLNRDSPLRSRQSLRRIHALLKAEHGVVVFPEGTYFQSRMGPGQLGMVRFILMRQSLPVVCAGLRYTLTEGRRTVHIRFGPRRYRPPGISVRRFFADRMDEIARLSGLLRGSMTPPG